MTDANAPAHALRNIVKAASLQLSLIEDASQRPDVAWAELSQQALELLLRAVASEADKVVDDEAFAGEAREELKSFVGRLAAHRKQAVSVQEHLIELAAEWRCAPCGADVARAVRLSAVKQGKPTVAVVCKACGQASPASRKGVRLFYVYFGELVSPAWNPTVNGFLWDGT
jgi:hypothetical protein